MKILVKFILLVIAIVSFVDARQGCMVHFKYDNRLKALFSDNFVVAPILAFDTKKGKFVDLDSVPRLQFIDKSKRVYGDRNELVFFEKRASEYLEANYFIERMYISPNERFVFVYGYIAKSSFSNIEKGLGNYDKVFEVRGENVFRRVVCGKIKPTPKRVLTLREQNGFLQHN